MLNRKHGAHGSSKKEVQKKSFDQIVFVMSEGDLVTAKVSCCLKEDFPADTGAQKAGIFPVVRAMGLWRNIRANYAMMKPLIHQK